MINASLFKKILIASLLLGVECHNVAQAQIWNGKKASNEKYGFYDTNNKCVIPPIYNDVGYFGEKTIATYVQLSNGKYNYIDRQNHLIFDEMFDTAGLFKKGMALVSKDKKFFFIDYSGQKISPYFRVVKERSFKGWNYLIVQNEGSDKYVLLDYQFNKVLPGEYDKINLFEFKNLTIAEVTNNKVVKFLNLDGKEAFPSTYESIELCNIDEPLKIRLEMLGKVGRKMYKLCKKVKNTSNFNPDDMDFFVVGDGTHYGLIDACGQVLIPLQAKSSYQVTHNYAAKNYKKVIKPYLEKMKAVDYLPIRQFYTTDKIEKTKKADSTFLATLPTQIREFEKVVLSHTRKGGYYFTYAQSKKRINKISYQYAKQLDEVFIIKKQNKYGIADWNGNEIIPCNFETMEEWTLNPQKAPLVQVSLNKKKGVIDRGGCMIIPCKYDEIELWSYEKKPLFLVTLDNKKGILDEQGNICTRVIYDDIYFPIGGFGQAIDKSQARLVDSSGHVVGNRAYEYIDNYTKPSKPVGYLAGFSSELNEYGYELNNIPKQIFKKAYNLSDSKVQEKYDLYCLAIKLDNGTDGVEASALRNIGVLYQNGGNEDKALEYYDRAAYKGDAQGKKNAKDIRFNRRMQKLEAIGNALQQVGDALANGTNGLNFQQNINMNSNNNTNLYNSSSSFSESSNSASNSRDASMYTSIYKRWERNAESCYNSLTSTGTRYKDKDNNRKGSANGTWGGANYTMMKSNLREAQREMRKVREEARRKGISISQSKWETATVSY